MISDSRAYSAGKFALVLGREHVGFLASAEGGEPFATVVREPVSDGIVGKHVGKVEYAPLRLSFGTGMTKELYDWVAEFLRRERAVRSGAIAFLDYDYKERSRVRFERALITEVLFPALDAARKDPAYINVTIQPETTSVTDASSGTAYKSFGAKTAKKWSVANFDLKIRRTAAANVKEIAAITVRQAADAAAVLEVPDITLAVAQTGADGFADWFARDVLTGGDAPEAERTGTLRFLDPKADTLFTLTLSQLCVTRLWAERQTVGKDAVLARTGVQLYCETVSFESGADAIGTAVADKGADAAPAPIGAVTEVADTLVGIISGRLRGEDAVRAVQRIAQSPVLSAATDRADDSERVARRLISTIRLPEPAQSDPRRADGAALGARWAAERATLEELEHVAALDTAEWSAMTLTNEHSLLTLLGDAGIVPRGDGRLDLQRDNFVEGIVAGASGVLRVAAPHLVRDRPSPDKS